MKIKTPPPASGYLTTVLTIFVTVIFVRVFLLILLIFPMNTAGMYTDQFHHYYLGLTILLVYLAARRRPFSNIIAGIGLGLIIDEFMLPLYLMALWNQQYWSFVGMVPIVIVLSIMLLLMMAVHYRRRHAVNEAELRHKSR